ncbi:MAG: general secretion pathway protein GspK [Verrucomicrobia bacterium]|nr:general secretion pathway protein GspK [Verrucomicrobiota bacterium]MBU4246958.1 general secretion pathway protein GspK [Verrucomicrobiota bacterium]MBU4291334.1 general secretion pathway protein GspK [Verrucomicrobiota bacterium]MBU4498089.1 general secretion pathway protein GspK [Verrucomicrobiota bacterium]MCG2680036.1 type II secretion system protein GspK [Kiritimatiellia bacterium]
MILVLVLVLLGMITALVIQSQMVARMTLGTEERKIARVQLRAAATDAAWEALRLLVDDDDRLVDHTNEPWATPGGRLLPNGIETSVQIEDENRRFDINSLSVRLPEKTQRFPLDIVRDILALSRQPDPLVQAQVLQDWLDPDHAGLREEDYYRSLNPPVTIADALMESPQELAEVLARSGSRGGVPPGFAVLPDRARRIMPVNLNTAERDVILAVLGPQNAAAAATLIGLRDAGPLASLTVLNRLLKTGPENPWSLYFNVKSSFFSVTARAAKGEDSEEVYALVCRDAQGNVDILRWVCQ